MKVRPLMILGVVGMCLLGSSWLYGETIELQMRPFSKDAAYDALDDVLQMTMPQHFMMHDGEIHGTNTAPTFASLAKKEPAYQSKKPFKAVAQLGDHHYALALDSTNLKKGYDRLYFDRNRNGDLTDEKPIVAIKDLAGFPGLFSHRSFPPQILQIETGGVKFETSFEVSAYSQLDAEDSPRYVSVSLRNHACREGKLTLNGKAHRVFVLDYNSNGRFDDACRVEKVNFSDRELGSYAMPGDMVLIDPEAKQHNWGYDPCSSSDRQYLSKLLNIGDKYYTVKITPAGDRLTVEPAKLPMAHLVNDHGPYRALLDGGERGVIKISGDKHKPAPVPAGEWCLLDYQIDLTGVSASQPSTASDSQPASQPASAPAPKRKSLWSALASIVSSDASEVVLNRPKFDIATARATAKAKPVKVAAGKTETLPFGPPYRPVVTVDYREDKKEARLTLSLLGSGGEEVSNLMVKGDRPSPPSFKIHNNKGELVKQGKFEFG